MLKTLILMRHAKAVPEGSMEDFDRPLSEIGTADASTIGQHLLKLNVQPNFALVSTAARTRETFAGLQRNLPIPHVEFSHTLYLASPIEIFNHIYATPDEIETLLVIAHNPGIAELALALTQPLQRPTISASKFVPATTVILKWPSATWDTENPADKCTLLNILKASMPVN